MPFECPISFWVLFHWKKSGNGLIHGVNPSPLIYKGLAFSKNHRRGWPRLLCKKGEGSPYRWGGVYIKGEYCFSLIRYEFFWSNALYSASLSFKMFIFLLTAFDTWECDSFGLNLSQVLLMKVLFFKKACNIAF